MESSTPGGCIPLKIHVHASDNVIGPRFRIALTPGEDHLLP